MSAPVISIILPTRNRLSTIKRTIDRILAQTFTDWELVISDNASDEAGKADYLHALAAKDPRIKVHIQSHNIGIHANWIFCIQQCQGRYYIPTTDDDWWGEDTFLAELLSMHDGKTASVFPNMCMHHVDKGEEFPRALSPVYGGVLNRYQLCERLVKDGRGVIMVGLIDMSVLPKSEIIGVLNNGLVVGIETVGMNRIARDYTVKFCEAVSYHHSSYSGNYFRSYDDERCRRDQGISTFLLLDDLRLATERDSGYAPALAAQWEKAKRYCLDATARNQASYESAQRKVQDLKEEVKALKAELKKTEKQRRTDVSTLRRAILSWWRNKSNSPASSPGA